MSTPVHEIDPGNDSKTVPRTLITERPPIEVLTGSDFQRVRPALQVVGGTDFGTLFAFPEGERFVVAGRAESCAMQLNDPSVSRRHARFVVSTDGLLVRVELEDLGSTNGSQVNQLAVQGLTPLADGDKVWIGDVELRFRLMDSDDIRFQSGMQKEVEAAQRDALTGLYSRRYLTDRLGSLVTSHGRNRVALSLAIVDIDHFKRVNDTYGHVQGDSVLFAVAEAVRSCIRGADVAVRYGGEEFAIILPGASQRVALRVGERVRAAVAALRFRRVEPPLGVTVSVGVATIGRGEEIPSWIERADRALYAAKSGGRDLVRVAGPPLDAGGETERMDGDDPMFDEVEGYSMG